MTDKEMAVIWIRSQGWNEENLPSDEFRQMFQAFLAGLKAGRLKWHNLKENPTDLPKEFDLIRKAFGVYPEEKTPHIVMNQDGESVYCVRTIGNKQKAWYWAYADDDLGFASEPIAWCEIPKYTKE